MDKDLELDLGRRRTLATGGAIMAGLLAGLPDTAPAQSMPPPPAQVPNLPAQDIQRILRGSARVSGPVLRITQLRNDLNDVLGPANIPFKPVFAVRNDFYFQGLPNGRAILNGELAVPSEEVNAVIDRILSTGLILQSFHQHFFNLEPPVWHIHLRGAGSPYGMARGLEYVVRATATPLPQSAPTNPSTTLDAARLGRLLGGQTEILQEGVVAVHVLRREQVTLDGVPVDPRLNLGHEVRFEPLADGRTAVAARLALLASEVGIVLRLLRREAFDVHALANQETAESPQLLAAQLLAAGNPYVYARALRRALQQTGSRFMF